MKKTVVLIVMLTLGFVELCAQTAYGPAQTSEGTMYYVVSYIGMYQGQEEADRRNRDTSSYRRVDLSKGQLECVRQALNRFDHRTGETYSIIFTVKRQYSEFNISAVAEWTSAVDFNYWGFVVIF